MTGLRLDDRRDDTEPRRETDRPDGSATLRIKWSVVFQVIGYAAALVVLYNALTNRITSLEVNRDEMRSAIADEKADIREIKSDIKTLLRRTP